MQLFFTCYRVLISNHYVDISSRHITTAEVKYIEFWETFIDESTNVFVG